MLARGITANYAPENKQAEVERLAELFEDMAMSRNADAEFASCSEADKARAANDAEWLSDIATALECFASQTTAKAKSILV